MDRADGVRAMWSLGPDRHEDAAELRSAVDVMVRERRDAIRAMRTAIRDVDAASVTHCGAEENRSKADETVDGSRLTSERYATNSSCCGTSLPGDAMARQRRPASMAVLTIRFPDCSTQLADGESVRLGKRHRLATRPTAHTLRDEDSARAPATEAIERQRGIAELERDAVAAEEDPGPATPPWRMSDRSGRAGAPLWACCDFTAPSRLSAADRAGIEAALDAAGLLDAWLSPEGVDDDGIDAWLRPVDSDPRSDEQPTLGRLLLGRRAERIGVVGGAG